MTEAEAVMPNDPSPIALHADPSDALPIAPDEENPEWTEADFANARPIDDFPALMSAFRNGSKPRLR